MKTKLFLVLSALSCLTVYSQNITNTLGTNGTFTIKNSSTNYLTLSQSTGNTSVLRNFELGGVTTSSSTVGVITKNGIRFLHNYMVTGTGGRNIFIGINSGNFTMSGTGGQASYNSAVGDFSLTNLTTGSYNSAFGSFSLALNTTGSYNSAFGDESLFSNNVGSNNSAFGYYSLYNNTYGDWNSAFGTQSLYSNTSGPNNSAFGYISLYYNSTGYDNSAFGTNSLYNNTTGYYNTAFGSHSLYTNNTGYYNSAFGSRSLFYNTGLSNSAFGNNALENCRTGSQNSALGVYAGIQISTGSNNTAIGYNAQVPSGTLSDQVRIGNTAITYAGIQVAWTITSDRRWKDNILYSNLGLNFISKLNPVSYFRKNDKFEKTEYGLIAQEVEEVLKQEGVENSAMITVTNEGNYELRYNDLLAPMIKSIQELNEENQKLKTENQNLSERLDKYEELQSKLAKKLEEIESMQKAANDLKLTENSTKQP